MAISRRTFCAGVIAGSGLRAMPAAVEGHLPPQTAVAATGSHIGNLYPFVQAQADKSPLELSFLRPEFKDLRRWQTPGAQQDLRPSLLCAAPRGSAGASVAPQRHGRLCRGVPHFPDLARRPGPGICARAQESRTSGARHRRATQSRRSVFVGKGKGDRRRAGASLPDDIQAATLRRKEHRRRAGSTGLRRDRDRHVLLGRAAHAPGRRPTGVPGAAARP